MKKLMALVLAVVLLSPAMAFAGSSTDAALGLGAFAVFNQILGGVGLFGLARPAPVYAPAPVVVAPPPQVVYAPPQVVYAPPPPVVVVPPPVVVRPAPVVVVPPPLVVGRPVVVAPRYHPPVYYSRAPVVYRHW